MDYSSFAGAENEIAFKCEWKGGTVSMSLLTDDAKGLMEHGYYERAVQILQECLQLEPGLEMSRSILDDLGYCFLSVGWFEEAAKLFSEYLKIHPSDNDGLFYLASAYASLKWIDSAINEFNIILEFDPTDILARHGLGLCYQDKAWLKQSLGEMRKANTYANTHGTSEEKEIVEASLDNLEREIEDGDEDGMKETL